jgi:hypothetical protein
VEWTHSTRVGRGVPGVLRLNPLRRRTSLRLRHRCRTGYVDGLTCSIQTSVARPNVLVVGVGDECRQPSRLPFLAETATAPAWRSRTRPLVDARTLRWVGPPADRDLNSSIDLGRAAAAADGGRHGGWPMGWDGSSMIRAAAKRSIIARHRCAVLVEGAVEVLVAATNTSLIQATPRNLRSALTHRGRHFLAAASRFRLTAKAAFTSAVGDRIATSRTFALKP